MNRYRFVITANDFQLATHFSTYEQSGLDWCKRYMRRFQKQVANIQMKVSISAREKQAKTWEYNGKPYIFQRTLIKKPRTIE
jgi:hypothetical protein